jgi:hypothetical protein
LPNGHSDHQTLEWMDDQSYYSLPLKNNQELTKNHYCNEQDWRTIPFTQGTQHLYFPP